MAEIDKAQSAWALVGKIAVLLAVVTGAVGLYDRFSRGAHLDVHVFAASYRYPPNIPPARTKGESNGASPNPGETGARSDLSRMDTFEELLGRYQGFIEFDIDNSGGTRADDVVVDLPYSGVAEIQLNGSEIQQLKFDRSIRVGAIPPTDSATVYAWTTGLEPAEFEEKEIRVTHATGVGSVVFLHKSDGFWRTLGRALFGIAAFVGVVTLFFVVVALIVDGFSRLGRAISSRGRPPPPAPPAGD
jgi:hypothetical protein